MTATRSCFLPHGEYCNYQIAEKTPKQNFGR
jgi:hypothetical protein